MNPQMELDADAAREPDWFHVGIVRAWMLSPGDPAMREQLQIEAAAFHLLSRVDAGETFSPAQWREIVGYAYAARPPADAERWSERPERDGLAAGVTLYNAILGARRGMSGVLTREMGKLRPVLGRGVHSNSSLPNQVWKTFRPVAHLWAACILRLSSDGDPGVCPCEPEELPKFLATAESFRELGEAEKLPKAATILPPEETVRLDPGLVAALPERCLIPKP